MHILQHSQLHDCFPCLKYDRPDPISFRSESAPLSPKKKRRGKRIHFTFTVLSFFPGDLAVYSPTKRKNKKIKRRTGRLYRVAKMDAPPLGHLVNPKKMNSRVHEIYGIPRRIGPLAQDGTGVLHICIILAGT